MAIREKTSITITSNSIISLNFTKRIVASTFETTTCLHEKLMVSFRILDYLLIDEKTMLLPLIRIKNIINTLLTKTMECIMLLMTRLNSDMPYCKTIKRTKDSSLRKIKRNIRLRCILNCILCDLVCGVRQRKDDL